MKYSESILNFEIVLLILYIYDRNCSFQHIFQELVTDVTQIY